MPKLRLALLLRLAPLAALTAGCGEHLVDTQVRLALEHSGLQAQALSSTAAASACDGAAQLCTPTNLSGRIYSGGAMWGQLGPEAFNVTMLGADAAVIHDPSQGMGGTLPFSLIEATVLGGQYESPGSGGEAKPITRMEFNYDFLDATFNLDVGSSTIAGPWVIRTVFVTSATSEDVDGTMQRGDKLLRRPGEAQFRWCNPSACSQDRAAVATGLIQEAKLVDYSFPGQGNPAYIPFTVPVRNGLMLSGDELDQAGGTWSAAFDMSGVVQLHPPAAELASPSELLSAFELSYEPDQAHAGQQTTISADLRLLH